MTKNLTKNLTLLAIIISISALGFCVFIMAKEYHKNNDDEYRDLIKQNYQIFSAIIPNEVSFCGKTIPLDNVFVREALDKELTIIMYNHSKTFLILKNAERYFPIIEPILANEGVPDDIKYLAVAESGLTNAISPVKAEGFWQFMLSTAKEYGMDTIEGWDDRYDLEMATKAACQYLKEKKNIFNDWALACAAFNSGERAVKTRLQEQDCSNYWDLYTNSETSRYVYRIIAYKLLMESPQEYGYYIRKKDTYQPIPTKQIIIDTSIVNLYTFAKDLNITYKHLRELNPAIRGSKIVNRRNKKLKINIPIQEGLSWKYLIKDLDNGQIQFR